MNTISFVRGPRSRVARIVSFCLACLVGDTQAAGPSVLGLDQAVALALRHQPQLERIAGRIHAAEASATAEAELPDPRLTLGLSSLPLDSLSFTRDDMTQAVVGVSQVIPGGRKRQLAGERMRVEAGRNEAELAATRLRIARDVAQAWLDLYYPEQALGLLADIAREYGRELDWADVALATGGLNQADALALRMQRIYVQDQMADLQREVVRARVALQRWTGTLAADVHAGGELPQAPEKDTEAGQPALDAHPELTILRRDMDLARSEAALAREAYKSDWEVDVAYGLRGGGRTDMLSVQVAVDLPLFPKRRQDRRLAARLAAVDSAGHGLEDRRRALAAELASAQAEWQAANARIVHFRDQLLPLAQRRVESALVTYRTGKSPYSGVLEARRAELEARLQLLRQQVARARAAIDLRYYLGNTAEPGPGADTIQLSSGSTP
ncbi:MAG TPA: TolC family protein [Thiobacillaceae bacterium]|nr:TolC family protein [Thiobacillaceae bacterium]HNU64904.1 TolC family protein [Thiobacillaceae bacterium]